MNENYLIILKIFMLIIIKNSDKKLLKKIIFIYNSEIVNVIYL